MEKEKEMVSEHLLNSLTEVGRAEMTENAWMKKEVARPLRPANCAIVNLNAYCILLVCVCS